MGKVIPELTVSNIEQSLAFYAVLGFTKDNEGIIDEQGSQWYSLASGDASVWIIREDIAGDFQSGQARGNGVTLYLPVDDVDALYEKVKTSGLLMNIVKEIETLWYGLRQFTLADPDGYIWILNTPVPEEARESVE